MRLTASVATTLALLLAAPIHASPIRPAPIRPAPIQAAPSLDGEREAGLGMPLSGFERISSPYGWRIHPILRRPEFHKGVDFPAPAGTPVVASAAGTIELAGRRGNYGRYVRLRHEGGLGTGYAHLQRIRPGLRVGSRVERGEVIGFVGASGLATGPHLFYEVFRDGSWIDPGSAGLPIEAGCCGRDEAALLDDPKQAVQEQPVQEQPVQEQPSRHAIHGHRAEASRPVEPPKARLQPASRHSLPVSTIHYRLVAVGTPGEARQLIAEADPAWQRGRHP